MKAANKNTVGLIARAIPFTGSNFAGVKGSGGAPYSVHRWYLSGAALEKFIKDQDAGKIVYSVWSYATPIGWLVEGEGWVIPPVRYSSTTTRHQSYVKRAAAGTI
jgi:hypothetical protein